ncbi:MAG: DEAD/DEAH box helicase [Verrucomicrobiales bacterium]|nr:DEAD/DEAH box helicase [Verrucomicrobiales bacterium]
MTELTFSQLGLPEPLLQAVSDLGYEAPSAIQAAAIPPAMEGRDLVGLSETGSGKTAAFGLAGLSRVDPEDRDVQMLVVCPTRELAVQVCGEIQRLASKLHGLKTATIYGGAPIDRQIRALKHGVQVVVGTPGRLIDLVQRNALDLSRVQTVVLDEADRMLDMGFAEDMESILKLLPEGHQTLFFSATMNKAVERLIQKFGDEPETIQIERKQMTVESIEQICFEVRQRSRIELTSRIIDLEQPKLTIIFCNTKRSVDECTEALLARGYSVDRLHGDIAQTMRERVLRMFREGTVEVLVATDVAARGIDVDDVDLVINYELPQDPEDYVHRVGRTGRAGREGKAVSFIYGRDAYRIRTIEKYTRQRIQKVEVPTQDEVDSQLQDQLLASIAERLNEKESNEEGVQFLQPLRELEHDWDDIAGALLGMVKELTARDGEAIIEDDPEAAKKRDRREDRGDRKERRERKPRDRGDHSREPDEGMVRLFLSLGKRDNVGAGDIVGMLHNECNLERGSVGHIRLMPNFSFVDIREDSVDQAIDMGSQATLRGKHFKLDRDRGPGPGGEGRGGGKGRRDDRRSGDRRSGGRRNERSFDDRKSGGRRSDNRRSGGRRDDRGGKGGGGRYDDRKSGNRRSDRGRRDKY